MNLLLLMPVILSFLLLAAHYFRGQAVSDPTLGLVLFVACLATPLLLFMRRAWAARLVQVALILGALEWLRTLVIIVNRREARGEPWTAAAIILASVALFTLLSGFVFLAPPLARRYFGRHRTDASEPRADSATSQL